MGVSLYPERGLLYYVQLNRYHSKAETQSGLRTLRFEMEDGTADNSHN